MKNLIKGTLIGTIVMFMWGATEWLNPLMHTPYQKATDTAALNQAISEYMPADGIYVSPNGPETKSADGSPKGAVYFISKNDQSYYNPERFMSIQFLTQILTWLLLTYILLRTRFEHHWTRVKFILSIGLLIGLAYYLPMWNWWGFSTEYVLIRWTNMMIGWFIAGAAVSYFLRHHFTDPKAQWAL